MMKKLAPRYIGPYKSRERIGHVAYQLDLRSHLARIHEVFHVSILQKAEIDLSRVLPQVPLEVDLTLKVKLVKILD